MSTHHFSVFALSGVALTAALMLSSCSSPEPVSSAPINVADDADFTGPWASEYARFYGDARSDFERGALEDSAISDQEFSEMTKKFSDCLASAGFSFSGFGSDGSYTAAPISDDAEDDVQGRAEACSAESGEGSIGALHSWIVRNPDNADEASIMVSCMQEKGIVNESYTAEDWNRENALSPMPSSVPVERSEDYNTCVEDPLGLFGN